MVFLWRMIVSLLVFWGLLSAQINHIKTNLATCANPMAASNFSVSHRGSPVRKK